MESDLKYAESFKKRSLRIRNEASALFYAYGDPATPLFPKCIIFLALAYVASPVDLIPDFIPLLGHLDDILVLSIMVYISAKLIPDEVMSRSRRLAAEKPVQLRKNIIPALLIIVLWGGVMIFILRSLFPKI